ncbi:hypothetical protein GCM10022286_17800 [Gryllotalpicola daejeonensis]|uniref:DUF222 domain-containing protein n=1 Tax=Gryllotalpicola daejeonensis TaxID=993087 RepID=A0ABP7ZK09_9MICO
MVDALRRENDALCAAIDWVRHPSHITQALKFIDQLTERRFVHAAARRDLGRARPLWVDVIEHGGVPRTDTPVPVRGKPRLQLVIEGGSDPCRQGGDHRP